jgi:hypothetical protein
MLTPVLIDIGLPVYRFEDVLQYMEQIRRESSLSHLVGQSILDALTKKFESGERIDEDKAIRRTLSSDARHVVTWRTECKWLDWKLVPGTRQEQPVAVVYNEIAEGVAQAEKLRMLKWIRTPLDDYRTFASVPSDGWDIIERTAKACGDCGVEVSFFVHHTAPNAEYNVEDRAALGLLQHEMFSRDVGMNVLLRPTDPFIEVRMVRGDQAYFIYQWDEPGFDCSPEVSQT